MKDEIMQEKTNYGMCSGKVVKFGLGDIVCSLTSEEKMLVTGIFITKNKTEIIVTDKNKNRHPIAQQYLKLAELDK